MPQEQSKTPGYVEATNAVAALTAAATVDLLELQVADIAQLVVEIVVTTQALDAFIMQGKTHPSSAYATLKAAWTVGGIVVDASGALNTQGAGTTGWAVVNVEGFHSIKFQASAAVDGANVTIRARGHGAA